MSAFVEHKFDKGFILDETTLRKLNEIISKRFLNIADHPKLIYHIYRDDSYSYVTESLEDIINEHNDAWRKITKLSLENYKMDEFTFEFIFSSEGAKLEITGKDRDEIYLLFSDLREYVNNEIAVRPKFFTKSPTYLGPSLLILGMIGMVSESIYSLNKISDYKDPAIDKLLKSTDVNEKLNYLLYHKTSISSISGIYVWLLILLIICLISFTGIIEKICSFMLPTNYFAIGKMKEKYDSQKIRFNNVFWIVVVGLIVSIIAGIIVWKLTK